MSNGLAQTECWRIRLNLFLGIWKFIHVAFWLALEDDDKASSSYIVIFTTITKIAVFIKVWTYLDRVKIVTENGELPAMLLVRGYWVARMVGV